MAGIDDADGRGKPLSVFLEAVNREFAARRVDGRFLEPFQDGSTLGKSVAAVEADRDRVARSDAKILRQDVGMVRGQVGGAEQREDEAQAMLFMAGSVWKKSRASSEEFLNFPSGV